MGTRIFRRVLAVTGLTALLAVSLAAAQEDELTVSQIMTAILTPMTSTIWGAYDIQAADEWRELQNAALTVIAAGTLLKSAGPDAADPDWQAYNQQMIAAARAALTAIENQDEEALFNAGNDQLYPPCESCHQQFMSQ